VVPKKMICVDVHVLNHTAQTERSQI
jgi:hypothetical protein